MPARCLQITQARIRRDQDRLQDRLHLAGHVAPAQSAFVIALDQTDQGKRRVALAQPDIRLARAQPDRRFGMAPRLLG